VAKTTRILLQIILENETKHWKLMTTSEATTAEEEKIFLSCEEDEAGDTVQMIAKLRCDDDVSSRY